MLIHVVSCFFFYKRRISAGLFFLVLANVVLRLWAASLDPFLNNWDEKFHALVAKNLSQHWLMPTLVDKPYLPTDPHFWFYTHVWLHKQPLFLWQMALSVKVLGTNTWGVRIPSLIMGVLLIVIIYDIGRICFDRDTGYMAAFMLSFYEPILDMNTGLGNLDHNSLCFVFYVTLSIWLWLKSEMTQALRWVVLFAIAAGCAILTKWLVGALVFGGYIFYHFILCRDLLQRRNLIVLGSAIVICLAVFLPWQLYIFHAFPSEAAYELSYNSRHFSEVIEGHSGGPYFYVDLLKEHYMLLQVFIFIGFAFCLIDISRYKFAVALIAMCSAVYLFFSLAATKMDEYVLVVSPLLILFIAFAFYRILGLFVLWLPPGIFRSTQVLVLCLVSWQLFHYEQIRAHHDPKPTQWHYAYRADRIRQTAWIRNYAAHLPPNDVVIGCPDFSYVDVMFYTPNTAFGYLAPDNEKDLRAQGKHLVYFGATESPQ